jgi:hypothetical protein
MANLKISQLPEYTGNTYNGYVIWNDSGETTTYKTRYQPQFIKGDASQSLVPYYFPTSAATAADTTYVDNFQVLGQAKYGNYNNGNRGTSYELDWDNGNIQKVLLTGNTTFSATNITDGTTYILKVVQDATGSRTATWTSSQFKFPNSTPPTLSTGANDVDILTFVAMDGVLYGVAQLNFG